MIVSLCMRTKPILLLGLVLALAASLSNLRAQCLRRAIQPKAKQEQAPTDSIKAKTFLPASKALVTGQISYLKSPHFRKLGSRYTSRQIYLQNVVADQFEAMSDAAAKDGISLKALSGTRTFSQQKGIWERKWAVRKGSAEERARDILRYSSMPMTSRHHWGTDIDINNLENSYFASGKGKAEYEWLCKHGHEYGFAQVFTDKGLGRPGYELEKWHWSYLPAAELYLEYYQQYVGYEDIKNFTGAEVAPALRVIPDYVGGVETPKAHELFHWRKK